MPRADNVLRLLLVDGSLTEADKIITLLRKAGHAVRATRYEDLDDISKALASHSWDLVLCRENLEKASPKETIQLIHQLGRDIPCIILVEEDKLSQQYSLGAQDIVLASDMHRLPFAINRELNNLYIRRLSRRNERALRESEKRAQLLLETSHDAVAYVHEGMHLYVNDAYLTLFGYADIEDVEGLSILDLIIREDHAKFKTAYRGFSEDSEGEPLSVEVQCVKEDQVSFDAEIEFSHAEVEGENCTQIVIQEILPSIEMAPSTEGYREVDILTGLYNRIRFMTELDKAVTNADEGDGPSELLYLVIEDVQKIKEKIGLSACDTVFKGAADRLKRELVKGEILARYSDQVFTFIIASGDDSHVDERAEAFRKTIDDYVSQANDKMIDLQCSIGISRITESLSSPEVALERADKACTQAHHTGGNKVVRYQPLIFEQGQDGDVEKDESAVFWKERIQESLQNDNFSLHYQPIVTLHGKEQELYDVLVRMVESDGSFVSPDKFMSHLEQSEEMMNSLDEWIIERAFLSLNEHQKEYPKTRFFIKLSKETLNKESFINWLQVLLHKNDVDGSSLVFEISETVALDNLEHTKFVIAQLKVMGCEFCLEHFGSGLDFSHSLNVLDIDYLKINGAFVENMAQDTENQAAVKSIIEMSKKAGKHSIAEFVSDANSLALLWRLGVDYVMGYYIQGPSDKLGYNFEDDDL